MSKMKRLASKKSYSWWWDSHISPKNSKWLAENLEEMDKLVKEMLKLIDEEGDSFAKKAEMYYQRRPELLTHVEDFYRMYRALAERYDNITGELRKSMPSKPQKKGSDADSGSPSPSPEHTPDHKPPKLKSTPRAAGFDVFLGSGGSSDISRKGSDTSSLSSDSESDSDDSKADNGNVDDEQRQRIIDLESELEEVKQKLIEYEEGRNNGSYAARPNEDESVLHLRNAKLEEELADAIERVTVSEDEIVRLKQEVQNKTQLIENKENEDRDSLLSRILNLEKELTSANQRLCASEEEISSLNGDHGVLCSRILELEGELTSANGRLSISEEEVMKLRQDLERNALVDSERSVFERQIITLESEIADQKREIEDLKAMHATAVEQFNSHILARDLLIEELKSEYANFHEKHQQEKLRLESGITDQDRAIDELNTSIQTFSQEKSVLEDKVLGQECRINELEEWIADATEKFSKEKSQLEAEILRLFESQSSLTIKVELLEAEKWQLEGEKAEAYTVSNKQVVELNHNLDSVKVKFDMLKSENDELSARVSALMVDIKCRDERISNMDGHLHQLHLEHVKLIKETQEARRVSKELQDRVKELEEEVERQRTTISDSAEGKREAIRQLCFSLEHYRLGYQELRQVLLGHKRPPSVLAT